jgi:tetratricopeptide (TPR) repeat protein
MVFYYLAEAYSLDGMISKSNKAVDSFLTSWPLPKLQKSAASAIRAQNSVASGKKSEGRITFDVLARENWQDPKIIAQTLNACSNVLEDCSEIVSSAEKLIQSREDRSYSTLNYALGRYYLARKNLDSAVSFMEAGRDKSYKNKIEYNDPLLLVDLADVYFKSKKFSEALEIFFEMSLQYPAVRQIQNAMQGVYSMVQESAGDVKVL